MILTVIAIAVGLLATWYVYELVRYQIARRKFLKQTRNYR